MGILKVDKLSGLEKEREQNPNLVANGDFSEASIDGWKGYNAVVSYDSSAGGRIKVDDSAGAGGWSNAAYVINTEPGASYRFEVRASAADSDTQYIGYYQGTYDTAGTTPTVYSSEITTTPSVHYFDIIATGTTVTILLIANNNGVVYFDDISFRKTDGKSFGGSVHFDGNDHLVIGTSGNYNFLHNGRSDWTAEFWAKVPNATRQYVFGTGASSAQVGFNINIMASADNQSDSTGVYASVGRGAAGNYRYWGAGSGLKVNTWHHIAAVFKSSDKTLALYIDGKEVDNDSGTASGTFGSGNYSTSNSSYALIIAKNLHGGGNFVKGYISNLRIVAGRRLYTSEFTPPVHELEPIDGTVVLCCNNPDSVTAVSNAGIGTAHINTSSGNPTNSTENPGFTRDFTSGTNFNSPTTFDTQGYFVPPSGTTAQRDASGGRGLIRMGPGINYITISTLGNAKDFGDNTVDALNTSACASSTRGLFAQGYKHPLYYKSIDYVTIASTGDAQDFGDITTSASYIYGMGGCASSTRGLFAGGFTAPSPNAAAGLKQINYVTIASLGDSQDFGDLTGNGVRYPAATSSPTRGIFGGGRDSADSPIYNQNVAHYVTIASTGDAIDFGDLTDKLYSMAATGSATRGLFAGGYNPAGSPVNLMDYITISSTGNAQDFGDMSLTRGGIGASSNATRATFAGGSNPSAKNNIEYVTIASTGDAIDFGDLISTMYAGCGCSNSHGGLS